MEVLQFSGVTSGFLSPCREIYPGGIQSTRYSAEQYTDDITLRMGITHGCPLSLLLSNFALEGMLSHLESLGHG